MSQRFNTDIEFLISSESHEQYLDRVGDPSLLKGAGEYAKVFEVNKNTVVRIGHEDQAYGRWAAYCIKNKKKKNIPKIMAHYVFINCKKECYKKRAYEKEGRWAVKGQCCHCETFSLTFIEKLTPLGSSISSIEKEYKAFFEKTLGFKADHYTERNFKEFKLSLKRCRKSSFSKLLTEVCALVEESDYNLDLHAENFLKRKNGCIVLADPLCH